MTKECTKRDIEILHALDRACRDCPGEPRLKSISADVFVRPKDFDPKGATKTAQKLVRLGLAIGIEIAYGDQTTRRRWVFRISDKGKAFLADRAPMKMPRQRQQPKTSAAEYRFGAGRAAATRQAKEGHGRKMSKLPTSLADLQEKMR